jgi:hypothetical protein
VPVSARRGAGGLAAQRRSEAKRRAATGEHHTGVATGQGARVTAAREDELETDRRPGVLASGGSTGRWKEIGEGNMP